MTVQQKELALAEARLSAPPSERMVKYHDWPQLDREKRMFREFLAVDLAHTTMLVEQGIITRETGRAILGQLAELEAIDAADFPIDVSRGSFLLQVEAYLFRAIGEDVGGQMHTGRSRIDQGATVRRLYKRNRILEVLGRILELQSVILEVAKKHSRTIMPGYTHMQHAQPWVFGHYLLSFSTRLHDSFERLSQSYLRVNRNPLGAVGLAGTSWPLDRARTTELLGFSAILENSKLGREAYYAADAISALAFVMADLNDLATDLHVWSSFEFGMVETHDAYCGTSSIFPQKKNPTALETIKKAAGASVTWGASGLAMFRAEGTGDQAVRELPLIDDALASTGAMLDLMAGVVETLTVHEKRMRSALAGSWCTASNLADEIVRSKGLSFRQVHHVVARLVRNCIARDVGPSQATGALLDDAAAETIGRAIGFGDAQVRAALDPQRFVETRVTLGGVSPAEVDRLLQAARADVEHDTRWLMGERGRIGEASRELKASVEAIIAAA
jgi:argininosuccinate lyase